jgi:hypothetical protein
VVTATIGGPRQESWAGAAIHAGPDNRCTHEEEKLSMLNTQYAISGKTLNHAGVTYKIKAAGEG